MRKIKLKQLFAILILSIFLVVTSTTIAFASKESELNEIDKKVEETKDKLNDVKHELSENINEIKKLNNDISNYNNEIGDLEVRIKNLNTEIALKEADKKEQEEKYEAQRDLLNKRLVALYESGETSYLDMLLTSDGLTDFISTYYTIELLAQSDNELLDKIEATRKHIEDEENYLKSAKEEIETSMKTVKNKKNSLAQTKKKKDSIVNTLSAEEKRVQEELEEFERDKARIQAEIAAESGGNKYPPMAPSAAGYICPLPGRSKRNITCGYQAYPGHTGVDFAVPAHTPIQAVKAGTVFKSTAARRPNGQYKSYGEYIIINHHDGTMTLYAHMFPNSRKVQKGQHVAQGQVIGEVGTTGNSTGNHLHFEVRVGGRPVNPNPYLP